MAGLERPLRILFCAPAYWPATEFGGPIPMAKELTEGLVRAGHEVAVLTTSLESASRPPASRFRTHRDTVGGVRVEYLATPLRFRWMGITPSLPLAWRRAGRPDVVHVFGFRDVVSTMSAAWAHRTDIPYVYEPLGMYLPQFRSQSLKHAFDRMLGAPLVQAADVIVANSEWERRQLSAAGLPTERIGVRPNGFPVPVEDAVGGRLRERLRLDSETPLVLNVGRVSFKKGLDMLLEAVAPLDGVHVAIVGPDDGDGTLERLQQLRGTLGLGERLHLVGPLDTSRPVEVYGDADVFALPSRDESFGMVAAEAASTGRAIVVSDRCGVAELLAGAALVVPFDVDATREAIARLLADGALRERLGSAAREVARSISWDAVVQRQLELYRLAIAHA
jgi:glycosyltransferase involved in cell wall biosynthesis